MNKLKKWWKNRPYWQKGGLIGFIVLLILSNLIYATPMAPVPSCDINGEIINITHFPERYVEYVENKPMRSCDPQQDTYYPAIFILKVRINNVSTNYNKFGSCIDMYPIREIREYIMTEDNYNKYPKEINDVGTWKVDCRGDECSGGCYIEDSRTTESKNINYTSQGNAPLIKFILKLITISFVIIIILLIKLWKKKTKSARYKGMLISWALISFLWIISIISIIYYNGNINENILTFFLTAGASTINDLCNNCLNYSFAILTPLVVYGLIGYIIGYVIEKKNEKLAKKK